MEFWLKQNERGGYVWTIRNVKKATKVEVLKMIDEGMESKAIMETLGITKGRVSQIRKEGLNEGLLDKKGRLTQSGFKEVFMDS